MWRPRAHPEGEKRAWQVTRPLQKPRLPHLSSGVIKEITRILRRLNIHAKSTMHGACHTVSIQNLLTITNCKNNNLPCLIRIAKVLRHNHILNQYYFIERKKIIAPKVGHPSPPHTNTHPMMWPPANMSLTPLEQLCCTPETNTILNINCN